MKAIVQDAYGSSAVLSLRDIDRPGVGDNDVLVQVRAVGLHIGDWHLMTGTPYLVRAMGYGLRAPKTRVRGMDVAGRVESVGRDVTRFRPGDEVFGTCDGALAEYASARVDLLAPKPANLSFEEAAAVPTSATTALQALRDTGQVRANQRVLVIGAGGGVGLYAVQLAKVLGAHVTGVCSTTKLDLVRGVGADEVIDYTREDFAAAGTRYDVILDTVGNRSLSTLRKALTPRGTLVIVGGEGGGPWLGITVRLFGASVVSPFVSQKLRGVISAPRQADLLALGELLTAGAIRPVIDRVYPLSEAAEAIDRLAVERPRGKIVVAV
ncbi:NAD(P)-dependent alcohol dehydrogenase [Cryobacterium fucosi]|uniref:NAD(P)-dependent alcohol dehydrogenase n=1 Tax=Cryobacterium fucosi TaxID=1259157 RepID=A0A4R9B2C0_9MICO|nr:NAD(P)-dependent alcohol dehydrogenase [Cryobacterium fucosi]TFD74369.1 NAD(P)-dependent alcohol dehydrogenase [Cryobacterium fucosi]